MQETLEAHRITGISESAESCGGFVLTNVYECSAMDGLGMYVIKTFDAMLAEDVFEIVTAIVRMFVDATAGIDDIFRKGGNNDALSDELPPLVPFELVKLNT